MTKKWQFSPSNILASSWAASPPKKPWNGCLSCNMLWSSKSYSAGRPNPLFTRSKYKTWYIFQAPKTAATKARMNARTMRDFWPGLGPEGPRGFKASSLASNSLLKIATKSGFFWNVFVRHTYELWPSLSRTTKMVVNVVVRPGLGQGHPWTLWGCSWTSWSARGCTSSSTPPWKFVSWRDALFALIFWGSSDCCIKNFCFACKSQG